MVEQCVLQMQLLIETEKSSQTQAAISAEEVKVRSWGQGCIVLAVIACVHRTGAAASVECTRHELVGGHNFAARSTWPLSAHPCEVAPLHRPSMIHTSNLEAPNNFARLMCSHFSCALLKR